MRKGLREQRDHVWQTVNIPSMLVPQEQLERSQIKVLSGP